MSNVKCQLSNVKKRGFTLLEALVAVFIFALMMAAVSNIFAKIIQTHRDTRAIQENLESAQHAMNLITKTLRTSSVVGSGVSTKILIYDYSQSQCIEYKFSGNKAYFKKNTSAVSGISDCGGAHYSVSSVIAENVDGKFDYTASSPGAAMGKATVSMTVSQGNDTLHIQSSVSLRDYIEALP